MKKTIDFHIRLNEEHLAKLQLIAEHYKTDKSKLLRKWIEKDYTRLEGETDACNV